MLAHEARARRENAAHAPPLRASRQSNDATWPSWETLRRMLSRTAQKGEWRRHTPISRTLVAAPPSVKWSISTPVCLAAGTCQRRLATTACAPLHALWQLCPAPQLQRQAACARCRIPPQPALQRGRAWGTAAMDASAGAGNTSEAAQQYCLPCATAANDQHIRARSLHPGRVKWPLPAPITAQHGSIRVLAVF